MARLIGLSRVSAIGQKTNTSLDRQADSIRKYCELYGHELIELREATETARGERSRKVFDQIISDVLSNKADGLIVMRVDRFARDTLEGLKVAHNLRTAGKILVIVELGLDTSTYVGRFFLTNLLASAELEANLIEDRAQTGRREAAEAGFHVAGRPKYGQKLIGARGQKQLTDNDQEAEIIELIKRLDACDMSLRKVASYLNEHGYKNRRGKPWAHSTIKLLLKYANEASITYGASAERPGAL